MAFPKFACVNVVSPRQVHDPKFVPFSINHLHGLACVGDLFARCL
jgi:hypothetical protein